MNKTRSLRVITVSLIIAMLAVLLMAFTVSAQSLPYSPQAKLNCKSVPVTHIVTSKKTKLANYKPNKLAVKVSSTLSLCIFNKTSVSQGVTYMGSVLVTIAAHGKAGILCNSPNSATFSLSSNPKAVLNLTCTA
jgi:hypothetical protein